ncbi:hypothetical protein RRG08_046853 [Elysia crispata]|uniref:Uncharacterized protein n=1 Tax=Elysia crispata TaxID=231223 RepID=A0AAE0ZMP6_9GAST|nr:hypothetical protein RRG08_046853 [Elysia crispata]
MEYGHFKAQLSQTLRPAESALEEKRRRARRPSSREKKTKNPKKGKAQKHGRESALGLIGLPRPCIDLCLSKPGETALAVIGNRQRCDPLELDRSKRCHSEVNNVSGHKRA